MPVPCCVLLIMDDDQSVESKTGTHYGPFESGQRMAERQAGAGLGRTGRRLYPTRRLPSLFPSSESKTLSWTSLREHKPAKSYVYRWKNEISG